VFYSNENNQLIIEKSISKLLKQMRDIPDWNEAYIQKTLFSGFWSYPETLFETAFKGIYRIPLGHQLNLNKKNKPIIERAWHLNSPEIEIDHYSFQDACSEFKNKIKKAIQSSLSKDSIAIELSGGLDSSAVTAFTRELLPHETLTTFSNGAPTKLPVWFSKLNKEEQRYCKTYFFDESKQSQSVSRFLNTQSHFNDSGYHFHETLEQYSEILAGFSEVLFPILNHQTYETAQRLGIKTLLSGFGGDEVVSQHAKSFLQELHQQKKYTRYYYENLRLHKGKNILRRLSPKLKSQTNFWGQATSHYDYLYIPENFQIQKARTLNSIKDKEYALIEGALSTHWQRRIETSKIIAEHYNINYAFPLADPKLMQFFHQLPSHFKFRHGKGRYLMRRSLEGMLPKSIIWRYSKYGATAPAAWLNLVDSLPELFLSRIKANHQGLMANYVNIPKIIAHLEKKPILNSNLLRVCIAVLMFSHFEHYLKSGS
jgi:asparagine synthase (glutamine-hydrolysing)